jgi:rod shape-determining protein MreC
VARAVRSGSRADTATLVACVALALFLTVLPAAIREDIAAGMRRTVVAPLIGLQTRAQRARNAFENRDATRARIDSLTLRNAQLAELEQENQRLRRLIGLGGELRWGFVPAEALHGRDGDEHAIVLTAGSNAGVAERAVVVAPDGLVGSVTSVDPETSLAILWTHPDFRVSAMTADGSTFGIIKPHLGSEPARYLLELQGVAFRDALKPGTLVRSSGLGSVYPRGIPIGTVMSELRTGEGWSRTYLVRPAVKPSDVTGVMIVLPSRGKVELSSIWATPAIDSARRGLLSASDSLAALARRDSIQRDTLRRDTLRPPAGRDTIQLPR